MDNEENESVKDRPAQVDMRYRPGTLGLSGAKTSDDSDYDGKSPYEKMLEDETEKENRRRQALDYGFVLGTPADESDGTILFNYDEPPKPGLDEEDYRAASYNTDSDSTLNNALRRAIREQQDENVTFINADLQDAMNKLHDVCMGFRMKATAKSAETMDSAMDQDINKRFMEGGSSGSSLGSVVSTGDADQQDVDVDPSTTQTHSRTSVTKADDQPPSPTLTHNASETLVSMFEPRPIEVHTPVPQSEVMTVNLSKVDSMEEETAPPQPQAQQQQCQILVQQTSPQEQLLQNLLPNNRQQPQTQHTAESLTPTQSSTTTANNDDSIMAITTPQASGKVKKMNFFKRFFSSKKHQ